MYKNEKYIFLQKLFYMQCYRFYHKYNMLRKINNDSFNLTSTFEL